MAITCVKKRKNTKTKDPLQIKYISTDMIFPNPSQPRKSFDRTSLALLADSIEKHGIIQPLTVKPLGMSIEEYISAYELKIPQKAPQNNQKDPNIGLNDENISKEAPDHLTNRVVALLENAERNDDGFDNISYILSRKQHENSPKELFYELISGERRLRAAKTLGIPYVPCVILEIDNQSSAEMLIIDKLIKKDIDMFEEADAINKLVVDYNMTTKDVAKSLSMSQKAAENKLKLLNFTQKERELMRKYALSDHHALALLEISDRSARIEAIEIIHSKKLNVVLTERYIEKLLSEAPKNTKTSAKTYNFTDKTVVFASKCIETAIKTLKSNGYNVRVTIQKHNSQVTYKISIPKPNVSRETPE